MNKVVIYGIVDPISNQLRYVGQTSNFIKRKSSHIRTALKGTNNSHLYNWLSSLFRSSINPEFIILEECNINRKSIGNVLAKRAKLAGGFNWTYN